MRLFSLTSRFQAGTRLMSHAAPSVAISTAISSRETWGMDGM